MNVKLFFQKKYQRALELATESRQHPGGEEVLAIFEDLVKAASDAVTKSVSRAFFFQRVHDMLEKEYPTLEEYGHFPVGPPRSYYLVAGDLAVLSLFNSISQSEGDRVLARAASAIINHFPDCWVGRIGGDEFAVLVEGASKHNLDFAIESIQTEVSSESPQWIDLAYANHSDVLQYLSLIDKDGSHFGSLPKGERISALADILVGVASYRAQINKGYRRIEDAIAILKDQGEDMYKKYMVHARKGACGISDEDVELIARHADGDAEVLSRACLVYILTRKRQIVTQSAEPGRLVDLLAMFDVAETPYYIERITL